MTNKAGMRNEHKLSILNDNLWTVMIKLSWPTVLAMMLYGLNTLLDAYFVGRFVGETALAGVSLAYPLTQIAIGIGSLIGAGAGSALSLALGAGDKKRQEQLMANVNYLAIIACAAYTLTGLMLSSHLVRIMGGTGEVLAIGKSYFQVTVLGSLFWVYGLALNMMIRSEGKMKSAALIMGSGLGVNLVFNYVFVVLLHMGVVGAALATNLGMLLYTLLGLRYYLSGRSELSILPLAIERDRQAIKQIITLGAPTFIMTILGLIQSLVVLNALSKYGTTFDVAFYGAVFRIYSLLVMPMVGLMRALQPVVGINYGAGKLDRVTRSYVIFSLGSMLLLLPIWIGLLHSPQTALRLMFPNAMLGANYLQYFRTFVLLLPVLPIMYMAMTFFPAIGKGKPASVVGIARQLVFFTPAMLILPRVYGIGWVYLGTMLIDLVVTVWVTILVIREFRVLKEQRNLLEKNSPATLRQIGQHAT